MKIKAWHKLAIGAALLAGLAYWWTKRGTLKQPNSDSPRPTAAVPPSAIAAEKRAEEEAFQKRANEMAAMFRGIGAAR